MDFVAKHTQALANIEPRTAPLETPIEVEKEKYEIYRYNWNGEKAEQVTYQATKTIIKSVDNA